jgi:hypothetical protein
MESPRTELIDVGMSPEHAAASSMPPPERASRCYASLIGCLGRMLEATAEKTHCGQEIAAGDGN